MTNLFKTILLGLTLVLCTVCRADSPETASARPDETDLPDRGGATLPRRHPGTVRFMTYNVRIFCEMAHPNAGKVVESVPAIRDRLIGIIDRADADFVALQEVDCRTERSGWDDQVRRLAEGTGMYGTFVDAIDRSKGKYGVGLLSREKPLHVERIQLPGSEELRVMMIAEFADCCIVCTHFSLTPEDRKTSVGILMNACANITKPILIGGDFNETPADGAISMMKRHFMLLSDPEPSYPADAPQWCLDYVWGLNLSEDAGAVRQKILLDEKEASDHRPWIVDVEL